MDTMRSARTSSDPPWKLTRIGNLGAADIDALLLRASEIAEGYVRPLQFNLGILMLQGSLRTRIGMAIAAQRMGGQVIDLFERPMAPNMTEKEPLSHTLRVASGMVDVCVLRCGEDASTLAAHCVCPLISGGDAYEHPVQALVDAFAIERLWGPLSECRLALIGDMGLRAARSLIEVLAVKPPKTLKIFVPAGRLADADAMLAKVAAPVEIRETLDLSGVDVAWFGGLPEGVGALRLPGEVRRKFAFTPASAALLPKDSIVLSPMPVIDEIEPGFLDADLRCRVFEQSDVSLAMRMAILEKSLDGRMALGQTFTPR